MRSTASSDTFRSRLAHPNITEAIRNSRAMVLGAMFALRRQSTYSERSTTPRGLPEPQATR